MANFDRSYDVGFYGRIWTIFQGIRKKNNCIFLMVHVYRTVLSVKSFQFKQDYTILYQNHFFKFSVDSVFLVHMADRPLPLYIRGLHPECIHGVLSSNVDSHEHRKVRNLGIRWSKRPHPTPLHSLKKTILHWKTHYA